jgi:hypothetical protein
MARNPTILIEKPMPAGRNPPKWGIPTSVIFGGSLFWGKYSLISLSEFPVNSGQKPPLMPRKQRFSGDFSTKRTPQS